MMDSALRTKYLTAVESDFRIAETFGITGIGPHGWQVIKSNWTFTHSDARRLLDFLLEKRPPMVPFGLPESDCHGFEPPPLTGGVLDAGCPCQCHIPIGSGRPASSTHSCVHCQLLA